MKADFGIKKNSDLAVDILRQLSRRHSDFVVMTGFRKKSIWVSGDVDICCRCMLATSSCLMKVITEMGGVIAHCIPNYGGGVVISGAFPLRDWATFRFDLSETPLLVSNVTFPEIFYSASADEFLRDAELVGGIYCPASDVELTHYIKRKILKNQFDQSVSEYVNLLLQSCSDVDRSMDEIFNGDEKLIAVFKEFLLQGSIDRKEAENIRHRLKLRLVNMGRLKRVSLLSRARRLLRKIFGVQQGLHIAFAAPDGSGKTTAIERIMEKNGVFGQIRYFHLRPTLLPAVSAKARSERENLSFKPHTSRPYGFFLSILKLLALYFDYTVGYLIKIKTLLFSPNLIISDRYFYDVLVDPRRFRLKRTRLAEYLFGRMIPRPDVCYVLIGDPVAISLRKNDLNWEQILEQNQTLIKLADVRPEMIVVNADANPDAVFDVIFGDLMSRLNRKIEYPQVGD